MKRVPAYKKVSSRTEILKKQGDDFLNEGIYLASILYYAIYTEQLLLTAYLYILRNEDIVRAIDAREKILGKKTLKNYDFGKIIRDTVPHIQQIIDLRYITMGYEEPPDLKAKCDRLRKIRNVISAHPHFALSLDPNNKWKKMLADNNYYAKVLRRIRKFIREDLALELPEQLNKSISQRPPFLGRRVEEDFIEIEDTINRLLASYVKSLTEEIRELCRVVLP